MKFKDKLKELGDQIKYFLTKDLQKFIWYILTEPFRVLKGSFEEVRRNAEFIQRIQLWGVLFAILAMIMLMVENYNAAKAFGICTILVVIHYEWKKGTFRHRWKEKEFKRIQKIMEKEKSEVKEHDNTRNMEISNARQTMDRPNSNSGSIPNIPGNKDINSETKKEEGGKKKMTDEQEVPTPPPMVKETRQPIPNFDLEEKEIEEEVRSNKSEDFKHRADKLGKDMSQTRERLINELQRVRQLKEEIYNSVNGMKGYYQDLSRKEKILHLTIEGLGNGGHALPEQEKKRLL